MSPAPHAVRRLEVSADGARLLVVREGGEPNHYLLLDLRSGLPLWEHRDPCCAGPPPEWAVRLAPGEDRALLLGFEPPAMMLDQGRVWELSFVGFDARFCPDGTWIGGSEGSLTADGTPLDGPPLESPVELVLPGPEPGLLRLVSEELVFVWDGRGPARSEGLWLGERAPGEHTLHNQGYQPVVSSPDGGYIVWSDAAGLSVSALATGQERRLPAGVQAAAWSGPEALWLVVADGELPGDITSARLVRVHPLTGEEREHLLPEGWLPTALAASTVPPALFVGGADGRVLRVDLVEPGP